MNEMLESLKAVSDGTRFRLLMLLREGEACVCELMGVFEMAQSKLSHHLIVLRNAGFLIDTKRGKWNYYRLGSLTGRNRRILKIMTSEFGDDSVTRQDRLKLQKVRKAMNICCER